MANLDIPQLYTCPDAWKWPNILNLRELSFNLPFSKREWWNRYSPRWKLHAEQLCKVTLGMTSLKSMLKGLHWALFAQIMQLNFGGQTAAQPEVSISKPRRSICHKPRSPTRRTRAAVDTQVVGRVVSWIRYNTLLKCMVVTNDSP